MFTGRHSLLLFFLQAVSGSRAPSMRFASMPLALLKHSRLARSFSLSQRRACFTGRVVPTVGLVMLPPVRVAFASRSRAATCPVRFILGRAVCILGAFRASPAKVQLVSHFGSDSYSLQRRSHFALGLVLMHVVFFCLCPVAALPSKREANGQLVSRSCIDYLALRPGL